MSLTDYFQFTKSSKHKEEFYEIFPCLFKVSFNKVYEELNPHLRDNHTRKSCCLSDDGLGGVYHNYNNAKWTPTVLTIKERLEEMLNIKFTYCAVQYYKDGECGIAWHNDKEALLSEVISVSFGSTRVFGIRKGKEVKKILLNNGDCLVMKVGFQSQYEHSILKEKGVKEGRLSLTFRR